MLHTCSSRSPSSYYCFLWTSLLSSKRHNFSSPFKLVFVLQQFVTQAPRMTCQTYNGCGLCKQGISPSPSVVLWLGYTSVRCQRAFNMLSFALPFDPQALSGLYKVGFSQHLTMKRLLYFSLTLNLVRFFSFSFDFLVPRAAANDHHRGNKRLQCSEIIE